MLNIYTCGHLCKITAVDWRGNILELDWRQWKVQTIRQLDSQLDWVFHIMWICFGPFRFHRIHLNCVGFSCLIWGLFSVLLGHCCEFRKRSVNPLVSRGPPTAAIWWRSSERWGPRWPDLWGTDMNWAKWKWMEISVDWCRMQPLRACSHWILVH